MKRFRGCVLIALLGTLATFPLAVPAAADGTGLTICNKTAEILAVAVGYYTPGVNDPADHHVLTGPFVSQGWYAVAPTKCTTIANKFNVRYMFWFAYSKVLNNQDSGIQFALVGNPWTTSSDDRFCVTNYFTSGKAKTFTYEDENAGLLQCNNDRNNSWVPVRKVDTLVNAIVQFDGT